MLGYHISSMRDPLGIEPLCGPFQRLLVEIEVSTTQIHVETRHNCIDFLLGVDGAS